MGGCEGGDAVQLQRWTVEKRGMVETGGGESQLYGRVWSKTRMGRRLHAGLSDEELVVFEQSGLRGGVETLPGTRRGIALR